MAQQLLLDGSVEVLYDGMPVDVLLECFAAEGLRLDAAELCALCPELSYREAYLEVLKQHYEARAHAPKPCTVEELEADVAAVSASSSVPG